MAYLRIVFILSPPRLWVSYFRTHGSEDTTKNEQRRTNPISNPVDGSTDSVAIIRDEFAHSRITTTPLLLTDHL